MSPFERMIDALVMGLRLYENDPGFGYRTYRLKDEDDFRVFRLPRRLITAANDEPPPQKGVFVSVTPHTVTGRFIIHYRHFPQRSEVPESVGALGYDTREIVKGRQHIVHYLTHGCLPVADGEYPRAN